MNSQSYLTTRLASVCAVPAAGQSGLRRIIHAQGLILVNTQSSIDALVWNETKYDPKLARQDGFPVADKHTQIEIIEPSGHG